tara:strand:+ start:8049 stop:8579 length:531 start_codon:yes stop_codon:yes gene_type:complete
MGNFFTNLFNYTILKRLIMIGLDNSGKTSLLYKMKLGEIHKTIPTIGFNVENIKYKKLDLVVWDIGGQDRLRPLWRHYFDGMNGVIFMVDINDNNRESEVLHELRLLVGEKALNDVPILIFMNKVDLTNNINISQFNQRCSSFIKSNYFIQPCSVIKDLGIKEGFEWLNNELLKSK